MDDYRKYEPIFGSYYIKNKIGQGSYGRVYEIERNDYGGTYRSALKIISVPQDESEYKELQFQGADDASISSYYNQVLEEIIRENKLMDGLKGHSNIVSYEYHEVIPHEDVGFDVLIRMELLTPLVEYLSNHQFDERRTIQLGIDMCRALEVCHRKEIIHRDIKPQNIFLNDNEDFKLGDFGIAKILEKTTTEMSKKGTYSYMAPEIYKGENYGLVVDIYSLGIVLYSLMNGNRIPFLNSAGTISAMDKENAINKRMAGDSLPPPVNASADFVKVILKACAYNPWERYLSAAEMRRALENLLMDKEPVSVAIKKEVIIPVENNNKPVPPVNIKSSEKNNTWKYILAGVFVLLVGIYGILHMCFHDSADGSIPDTAEVYNGSYYKVYDDSISWEEAKAACEEKGGHLVTITDASEQEYIQDLIERKGDKYHYWIGASDRDKEGQWTWVTGEKFDYTNWENVNNTQPNNSNATDKKHGEDYAEIQTTSPEDDPYEYMTWNDICNKGLAKGAEGYPEYCSQEFYGYICEWD